ncbi:hypothetical protein [Streptomyces sp. NPDC021212]|uniref:hypothetical protein n=1 Tax=Streptomyces sp. NPDC021212 TaxID=3365118 RepID=UPI00379AA6A4
MVASVALFLGALRAVGTAEARRHLDAGIWLVATLLAVLAVSYYGAFGPLATPPLGGPYDLLVIIALALVSYGWAVRSGFRTEQLDRALAEDFPSSSEPPRP